MDKTALERARDLNARDKGRAAAAYEVLDGAETVDGIVIGNSKEIDPGTTHLLDELGWEPPSIRSGRVDV